MIKDIINIIQTLFKFQTSDVPVSVPPIVPYKPEPELFVSKQPASITIYDTPNKRVVSGVRDIKYLIIHSTGGSKTSTIEWFKNPEAKASSHYLIDKAGNLFIFAKDNDITWHAGVSQWGNEVGLNARSIGIELENLNTGTDQYSDIQISVALGLSADLIKKYSIPIDFILRHLDIAPGRKIDPVNFPWDNFVRSIKNILSV